MGSSGWNATQVMFWACPSKVCTHVLFYRTEKNKVPSTVLLHNCIWYSNIFTYLSLSQASGWGGIPGGGRGEVEKVTPTTSLNWILRTNIAESVQEHTQSNNESV